MCIKLKLHVLPYLSSSYTFISHSRFLHFAIPTTVSWNLELAIVVVKSKILAATALRIGALDL